MFDGARVRVEKIISKLASRGLVHSGNCRLGYQRLNERHGEDRATHQRGLVAGRACMRATPALEGWPSVFRISRPNAI